MTAAREILQMLIDAGGTLPRDTFDHRKGYANMTMWQMRDQGLITVECHITDAGRAVMSQPPEPRKVGKRRKMVNAALDCLDGAFRHPIATTDEQIEKIKSKAIDARSLTFGMAPLK